MRIAILLCLLAVAGCNSDQQLIMGAVKGKVQTFNDSEAQILKVAPCAMPVGAYFRSLTNAERNAIATLCGQ